MAFGSKKPGKPARPSVQPVIRRPAPLTPSSKIAVVGSHTKLFRK